MVSVAGVKKFDISISESQIEDLKERLSRARLPNELKDSEWNYGSPLSDVKRLTKFWKDDFDWKAAQAKLNKLPQYRTSIQCDSFEPLNIHFVYQQSTAPNAIPLLFVHGCMLAMSLKMTCGNFR